MVEFHWARSFDSGGNGVFKVREREGCGNVFSCNGVPAFVSKPLARDVVLWFVVLGLTRVAFTVVSILR